MKLINLRGTNAAGKTTLVRALMALMTPVKLAQVGPVKYHVLSPGPTVVIGPYNPGVATGGCDFVKNVRDLPQAVETLIPHAHVLMEGLLMSGLQSLTVDLRDIVLRAGGEFHIITLSTPIDQCIADTQKRRDAVGNTKPFNPDNLRSKARAVELAHAKFVNWGWNPELLSREEAFVRCRELLCV